MKEEFYMKEALKEANRAYQEEEVPIGAIIVHQGKIIARAYNQVRRLKDPTAHAEILAITQAASYLGHERLNGCKMYVTIEPCVMCAGALILSRLDELIYGAKDIRFGAYGSLLDLRKYNFPSAKIKIRRGILEEECSFILQNFFQKKRTLLQ